jgi:hypothetical protein
MKIISDTSKIEKLSWLLQNIGIDTRMIPEEAYLAEDIGVKRQELAWLRFRLQADLGVEVPKNWQKHLSLGKIKAYLGQNLF